MGLGFKGIFSPAKENVAGYDWVDLASATGYVVYSGVNAIDSAGSNYMLIDASAAAGAFGNDNLNPGTGPQARPAITVTTGGGAGPTKSLDADFDIGAFQLPRTIEGEAYIGFTLGSDDLAATGGVYVICKLRKWDGASETEITSVQSETLTLGTNKLYSYALKITVPRTHFKQGENIRLTFELWTADNQQTALFHIPDDTAYTGGPDTAPGIAGSTRFSMAVPYRLDFM